MKKRRIRFDRKQAVTFVAAVVLLLLYMVIFSFSAQDAEQSSGLSHRISKTCVEVADAVTGGNWTDVFKRELTDFFEHPIRKLAHFMEYTGMGIWVYIMWHPWLDRGRKLYGLTIVWVFFSAVGDEIHQLFVSGRSCSFADVLLDTCGGAFGVLLCVYGEKFLRLIRTKRCENGRIKHKMKYKDKTDRRL